MGEKTQSDDGKRIRVNLFGENYYFGLFRCDDGGIDIVPTIPRENDPAMSKERKAVETICRELSVATRMI